MALPMEKRIGLKRDPLNQEDSLLLRIADNRGVRRRKRLKSFRQLISYFIFSALLLLCFTFVGWRLYAYLVMSPRFNIEVIMVKGTRFISSERIDRLLSSIKGKSIFLLELNQVQEMLKQNPWVEYSLIKRVLPNRLEIEIFEAKPSALLRIDGKLYLISGRGRLLERYEGQKFAGLFLPLIASRSALPLDSFKEELPLIMEAIKEVKAYDPNLLNLIAEFDLAEKGIVNLRLKEASFKIKLGSRDFSRRIKNLVAILPEIKKRFKHIDYIDLRFDHQVIIHQAMEGR